MLCTEAYLYSIVATLSYLPHQQRTTRQVVMHLTEFIWCPSILTAVHMHLQVVSTSAHVGLSHSAALCNEVLLLSE